MTARDAIQIATRRGSVPLFVSVAVLIGSVPATISAQGIWSQIKRAARQTEQPSNQPPAQQATAPANSRPQANATPASSSKPSGRPSSADCCSPEAMKKLAAAASFLDIGGIKLGMTPKEAFAAVQAFNPNLKILIINAVVDGIPGSAPVSFPHYAIAHTLGETHPGVPRSFARADNSGEAIALEFSPPPNPPLLVRIVRQVQFANGQPVVASTILDALRKKYGTENRPTPAGADWWVYGPDGKLLTRQLTGAEDRTCFSPADMLGGTTDVTDFSHLVSQHEGIAQRPDEIPLTDPEQSAWVSSVCRPLTLALEYGFGEDSPPDAKMITTAVAIASPALIYAGRKNLHDWIQGKIDARQKQLDDAAKQRSAPKF